MVRLSLSFLATALAAVASAAPILTQQPFMTADATCLPNNRIKEYQSFELLSHELDTYVSKKFDSTRLVGGVNGDKNLQKLEFCIVSSDHHCDPIFPTNCVLENVDYRFRIKGPEKGYLQIDGHYVRIVHNFEDASPLSLSNDDLLGVRIAYLNEDGDKNVLATSKSTEVGKPIVLEYPQKNRIRQRFELIESRKTMEKMGDNECIPETNIKEYHPFKLLSANLDTFLSMRHDSELLYGGNFADKKLHELQFCIVSTDMECSPSFPTDCIRQNVEYRFRVDGPIKGYLRVVDEELIAIVPEFDMASDLNLYKEQGWGLRVAHRKPNGGLVVITTSAPGRPVFLEEPQKNNGRQWFDLIQPTSENKKIELKSIKCVPEVAIKEYESFELYSYDLNSVVSKERIYNVLVGGEFGNKNLQQLQLCIVSTDTECNPEYKTNCIYEDVQYRYRVHSPIKGYLRIQDGLVRIVYNFEDATGLNLLSDENRGLRIAKKNKGGSVSVLATTAAGEPLTLEGAKKPTDSQYFALAKPNDSLKKSTTSLKKCLPDTNVEVYQPFIVQNLELGSLISTVEGNNLLRAGVEGNKDFQKLEFSVSPFYGHGGDCLQEDFEYRFEVRGQISGFLRVENGFLAIVPEYEKASPLYFHKSSSGQGLRFGYMTPNGPSVVTAFKPGMPLDFQRPESGNKLQVFDLIPSNGINKEESLKRCLPDTDVKVRQPFIALNLEFDSLISTVKGNNLLRAGVDGNKDFQKLEFSVSPFFGDEGDCLQEDVEYRFEVHGQISGFLRVENGFLAIFPESYMATPLYFHKSSGQGLRIGYTTPNGPSVVTAFKPGMPLALQRPESGNKLQVFDLIPSNGINKEESLKKCLPDTHVKVYQPFIVENYEFDSLISTVKGNNLLRAGVEGNKDFHKLEFSVSPFFGEATGDCLQEDFDYRFKVHGQISGFVRIENGFLAIVRDYEEASPLYFHKSAGQGLRIGHMTPKGPLVVAANEPGMPLVFQLPQSGNKRQVFDLIPSNGDYKEQSLKKCLPDTNVEVYQPFIVQNLEFDSLISTVKGNNLLRAGVDGNKDFQKLEFSVSPFYGHGGDCLQEDFEYRFEVRGQISGFLRVENGFLAIVPEYEKASPLYFHKSSSGQGLRFGYMTPNGPSVVTAFEPGMPLDFQRPESGNKRQLFELIPSNGVNSEESVGKCLPDTDVVEAQPFLIKNHALDSFVSATYGPFPLLLGGGSEPVIFFAVPYSGNVNPGECIYEDVEYRLEARTRSFRGSVQVQGRNLLIVPETEEPSPLYFHKSSGQGLRIGQKTPVGPLVVTTVEPGRPVILERIESKNQHQVFDLLPLPRVNKETEGCDDNQEHSLW